MCADAPKQAEPVSKSQRKREAQARRELGERLVALRRDQLEALDLPGPLREAIAGAKRITQRVARKRELQYVGKLLREIDVTPLEAALEAFEQPGIHERLRQHRLERWRDALLEHGDGLIEALCGRREDLERQRLRQLVLAARREHEAGRPPASSRALFRLLREADKDDPLPEQPLAP